MSPRRLPKLRPLSRRDIVAVVEEECTEIARMMEKAGIPAGASTARELLKVIMGRVMEPQE